jgi:Rieske Fe-S protein
MTTTEPRNAFQAGGPSRRAVLAVSATGVSALALAACSKAAPPSTNSPAAGTTAQSSTAGQKSSAATAGSPASSGSASGAKVLAKLSDIQVGAAVVTKGTDGRDILISRTGQTTVAAFSAICPHQGCTVANSFMCPCHGSTFDPKTGARISGPTPTGLATVPVAIQGGNVVAG